MDDVADVGFVDAHAEGDGGDNDIDVFFNEGLLIFLAVFIREASVIWESFDATGKENLSDLVDRLFGLAVDDTGFTFMPGGVVDQLVDSPFGDDKVVKVGTVKAGLIGFGGGDTQVLNNVLPNPLGGGGG